MVSTRKRLAFTAVWTLLFSVTAHSAKADLRIAVISDVHVTTHSKVAPAFKKLVAKLLEEKPDAVVVTGDSTSGNKTDGETKLARRDSWWAAFKDALSPLIKAGIAVHVVAGNHDAYLPEHRQAYAKAWGSENFTDFTKFPFSYVVDLQEASLVFTHLVDQKIPKAVRTWLTGTLSSLSKDKPIFVFGHVPAFSVMGKTSEHYFVDLGELLASKGVAAFIAGHEHLVWDEVRTLPSGHQFRQVIVGTASGTYTYGLGERARDAAKCQRNPSTPLLALGKWNCTFPASGIPFILEETDMGDDAPIAYKQVARQAYVEIKVGTNIEIIPHLINDRPRIKK